jgi:hypothetical protein
MSTEKLKVAGYFRVEIIKPGKKRGKIMKFPNLVTNAGRNSILNTHFNGAAQTGAAGWYIGLINQTGFTAIAPSDTMAAHGGWVEATGYTEANRPAWGPGSATTQLITNAAPAIFTINTGFTAVGCFLVNDSTKNGTAGLLFSAGQFNTGNQIVTNGSTLRVTYQLAD